mmetsp:Transcript_3046/g.9542  ORF Transcript_3046/g.9542 Transcript_3046/m.9542 type:complete len:205 (-) Transcript_3046:1811-2425(-)
MQMVHLPGLAAHAGLSLRTSVGHLLPLSGTECGQDGVTLLCVTLGARALLAHTGQLVGALVQRQKVPRTPRRRPRHRDGRIALHLLMLLLQLLLTIVVAALALALAAVPLQLLLLCAEHRVVARWRIGRDRVQLRVGAGHVLLAAALAAAGALTTATARGGGLFPLEACQLLLVGLVGVGGRRLLEVLCEGRGGHHGRCCRRGR